MALAPKIRTLHSCKAAVVSSFIAAFLVASVIWTNDACAQQDPRAHDPVVHLKQAKRLTGLKKYKEALQEVNKALSENPNYWEAYYQGAYIFQLQGRRKEAIIKYRKLLDRRPDFLQA